MNINYLDKIIIFDSSCIMCNTAYRFLIKRMRKNNPIYFASFETKRMKKLFSDMKIYPEENTLYYFRNKEFFKRSKAVSAILLDIGFPYTIIGNVIKIFPVSMADAFYNFIARNRYRILGKSTKCYYNPKLRKYILM